VPVEEETVGCVVIELASVRAAVWIPLVSVEFDVLRQPYKAPLRAQLVIVR
jgi:hypothetical protein